MREPGQLGVGVGPMPVQELDGELGVLQSAIQAEQDQLQTKKIKFFNKDRSCKMKRGT